MAKLILRFGNSVQKEVLVGESGIRIGRSPDNGLVIDNHAVSHHHARIATGNTGALILEDLDSMNGTFVNGQRVKNVTLKPGDSVAIGKHTLLVEDTPEMNGFLTWKPPAKTVLPKVNETVMLATKERGEWLQQIATAGENPQVNSARKRVATIVVQKGKANQREYMLMDKLTVIGKSEMATVKLRGWFAPKVAAHINRVDDNSYHIGPASKVPSVNGRLAPRPTKLLPGDIIEVAGLRLEFAIPSEANG